MCFLKFLRYTLMIIPLSYHQKYMLLLLLDIQSFELHTFYFASLFCQNYHICEKHIIFIFETVDKHLIAYILINIPCANVYASCCTSSMKRDELDRDYAYNISRIIYYVFHAIRAKRDGITYLR